MKKMALSLLVVLCFVSVADAKPMQAVVRSGVSFNIVSVDASHSASNLPAIDLDLTAIRKYVSYGFAARNRYLNSYAGNVKYFGIGGIVGYYSNMENSERFGWHAFVGLNAGPASISVDNGFKKSSNGRLAVHGESAWGFDYLFQQSKDKFKNPWDLAVTFDLKYEGFAQELLTSRNEKRSIVADMIVPMFGIALRR